MLLAGLDLAINLTLVLEYPFTRTQNIHHERSLCFWFAISESVVTEGMAASNGFVDGAATPTPSESALIFLGTSCSSMVPNLMCLLQPSNPPCSVCFQSLSIPPERNPNYRSFTFSSSSLFPFQETASRSRFAGATRLSWLTTAATRTIACIYWSMLERPSRKQCLGGSFPVGFPELIPWVHFSHDAFLI